MSTSETTAPDMPPGFAFLKFSGERYVLVNNNSDGHRSAWTNKQDMIRSAWDWWNDVRADFNEERLP